MSGARHAHGTARREARGLPLEGVRIVDLSRAWAGPYGTRYLADFGAEVIKVETGKYPPGRESGSPSYGEVNRNKRPITLNFQTLQDGTCSKRLVAVSDVVVENLAPASWPSMPWTTTSCARCVQTSSWSACRAMGAVDRTAASSASAAR